MIAQIKKTIQKPMIKKQHRLHEARIASQTVPYDVWLEQIIAAQKKDLEDFFCDDITVKVLDFSEVNACKDVETLLTYDGDIFLFTKNKELLAEYAAKAVQKYVKECGADIFYADELHYFKPDYSPELLECHFYFGNIFGISKHVLSKVKTRFDEITVLAKECLKVTGNTGHLSQILYFGEFEPDVDMLKNADSLRLSCGKNNISAENSLSLENKEKYRVSIVIPSKDNPAVLSTCIHSLLENTDGLDTVFDIEILVVDNGSCDENRARIEKMREQLQEKYRFHYVYEQVPFNFSHMCNIGAKQASSDYILFLNDDIEIRDSSWLVKMMYQAVKPGVGAVGAKLLYPDGECIQHAGITNIHLGPAHKLQFASDKQMHYMGYNYCTVNVLAVTGACLLVRKEVFKEVGGFDENLQVSFNDVEICFRLYSLGYRNVCCNNTYLYHHESLSRGSDAGIEKVRRLHGERDYLYGKYPQLWNCDPYYSVWFVKDVLDDGFESACRFEEAKASVHASATEITGKLENIWHNECLYMGIEFAGSEDSWINGPGYKKDLNDSMGKDTSKTHKFYIQGWSYAINVDNSRYQKKLLLKPIVQEAKSSAEPELTVGKQYLTAENQQSVDGKLWEIPYTPILRPDMASKLPYIEKPELTGVSVWFESGEIPQGEYLIGYLWEDTCSRQKLYGFTAETIELW